MAGENAFEVEGVVVQEYPNGTWQLELKNGHRFRGYATRKVRAAIGTLTVGARVTVRFSPADLSVGRILNRAAV